MSQFLHFGGRGGLSLPNIESGEALAPPAPPPLVIAFPVRKCCFVRVAPLEMNANSRPSTSEAYEPASVELEKADILEAALEEPLDVHNIAALCWWIKCHGFKPVHSWKYNQ